MREGKKKKKEEKEKKKKKNKEKKKEKGKKHRQKYENTGIRSIATGDWRPQGRGGQEEKSGHRPGATHGFGRRDEIGKVARGPPPVDSFAPGTAGDRYGITRPRDAGFSHLGRFSPDFG